MGVKKIEIFIFLFICLFYHSYGRDKDTLRTNNILSVRYSFNYNYKIIHHTPAVTFKYNNHDFYSGLDYSFWPNINKEPGSAIYKENTVGVNFGYRNYFFQSLNPKIQLFFQFNFSIYPREYTLYEKGPPFVTEKKEWIIENTGTLGLNYHLLKKLNAFTGFGIGSTNRFFLMIDEFIPAAYIGIEYVF